MWLYFADAVPPPVGGTHTDAGMAQPRCVGGVAVLVVFFYSFHYTPICPLMRQEACMCMVQDTSRRNDLQTHLSMRSRPCGRRVLVPMSSVPHTTTKHLRATSHFDSSAREATVYRGARTGHPERNTIPGVEYEWMPLQRDRGSISWLPTSRRPHAGVTCCGRRVKRRPARGWRRSEY